MWRSGHFVWEYKSADKSLADANLQAYDYLASLSNPPLVVVSDMDRIEVRTNFTNAKTALRVVKLEDLERAPGEALDVLHGVMHKPEELHPGKTPEKVTEEAAERFAAIAASMGEREDDPGTVAHFLNRVPVLPVRGKRGAAAESMLRGMIESRRSGPAAVRARPHPAVPADV